MTIFDSRINKKTGDSVKLLPVFSGDLKIHFSGHGKRAVRQNGLV